DGGEQRVRVEAFVLQDFAARVNVAAHHVGVYLGVVLDTVAGGAKPNDLIVIEGGAGQADRFRRQTPHGVDVREVGIEAHWDIGKGDVVGRPLDFFGAHFAAPRVFDRLAAEGLGEHLVAEANAEDGDAEGHDVAEPGFGAEHPAFAVGDVRR